MTFILCAPGFAILLVSLPFACDMDYFPIYWYDQPQAVYYLVFNGMVWSSITMSQLFDRNNLYKNNKFENIQNATMVDVLRYSEITDLLDL
jgi:hypothetical protein